MRDVSGLIEDSHAMQPSTKAALRIGILLQNECPLAIEASLSAAALIARTDPRFEMVAAATTLRIGNRARRDHVVLGTWVELVELPPATISARLLHGVRQVYADNLDFFVSLDILMMADANASILQSHFGLKGLTIISADLTDMSPERIDRLLPHFFAALQAGEGPARH